LGAVPSGFFNSKGTTTVRKAIGFPSLLLALTVAATAQQPTAKPAVKTPHAEAAALAQLPVTRVSLYKNGVGFFEHTGRGWRCALRERRAERV